MNFKFQFQKKEHDWNVKCAKRSEIDFYINLIFSDKKFPLFVSLRGGVNVYFWGEKKGANVQIRPGPGEKSMPTWKKYANVLLALWTNISYRHQ